jgi:putative endonuclease
MWVSPWVVTNNLLRRGYEHKQKRIPGFTQRYNLTWLIYCAETNDVRQAIAREKQIKGWSRAKEVALIEEMNPEWDELAATWYSGSQHPARHSDSSLCSE